MRKLEIMFESLYTDLYRQRDDIVRGESGVNKDLVEEFDQKVNLFEAEDGFKKLEVLPFEIKDTVENNP